MLVSVSFGKERSAHDDNQADNDRIRITAPRNDSDNPLRSVLAPGDRHEHHASAGSYNAKLLVGACLSTLRLQSRKVDNSGTVPLSAEFLGT